MRAAFTLVVVVIAIAALAPAPVRPAPPSGDRRALFDELVREEPSARRKAIEDWPHHRWSQQDAFGALERDRAARIAREKGSTTQDLLLVIDEGLRAGWPGPDGQPLDVTTVPLKPRPMD